MDKMQKSTGFIFVFAIGAQKNERKPMVFQYYMNKHSMKKKSFIIILDIKMPRISLVGRDTKQSESSFILLRQFATENKLTRKVRTKLHSCVKTNN